MILDLVDLFLYKVDEKVHIVLISECAPSIVKHSNINVDFLSHTLQEKILKPEHPFAFEALIDQRRLSVFRNMQEYLNAKREKSSFEEYQQEIIIASSSHMRIGEAAYWLSNLNKHNLSSSFLLLSDPLF